MNKFDVIIKPLVTEKSMAEMENNKYTFQVAKVLLKKFST